MRDQGQDDEMLKKMITPENFEKYKEVSRNSTTNTLKLSMAYGTIAEKEGLQVDPLDVDDQMELIKAETKADPDFDEAGTRDRVEASLIRELVLNWIAENSTVEVV
jgi:FKBP-type peptidyl-prolyl cis-trans isomerase (trigger factor)